MSTGNNHHSASSVDNSQSESLLDLYDLLQSWLIALRAERKSASTLRVYDSGVRAFLKYFEAQEIPVELTKQNVIAFMASLSDSASATAQSRLRAIKLFAQWIAAEGEPFDSDPIVTVKPPKLDQRVVPHLTDREIEALVKACDGPEMRDKRDKAALLLLTDTGARADELVSMNVSDVSVADCTALITRGKGGKGRRSAFSPKTAAALDRYMRARRQAGYSDGPLWIGSRGPIGYTGLKASFKRRAEVAGVPNFHMHRLRHSAAVRWLRKGGSESGLMAQAGWGSRKMVDRYVRSASEELAADEFARLNLSVGD